MHRRCDGGGGYELVCLLLALLLSSVSDEIKGGRGWVGCVVGVRVINFLLWG